MKKLFIFLTMLVVGIVSSWATDGSVTLTNSNVYFLRQKGSNGLYINVTSENATYLSSKGSPLVSINQGGGNINVSNFGLYTQTYTLAMPSNYTITSYVLTVTPAAKQTLVVGNGTADVTTLAQNTKTTITVSGVNAYSTTFQFKNNGGNGYNYIESIVVNYSYTTTPSIVHTMDDLECADYSKCPTYTLDCQRSTLYAESNTLTTVHAIEDRGGTPVDANKAFAFIKNTSTGDYYLYHVATGKFVTGNSNKELSATPTDAVNLYWTLDFAHPTFVKLGSNFINVQTSGSTSDGVVVNGWANADGGNSIAISPAGTADLTRAHKIVNGWNATFHIDGTTFTATGAVTYNGTLSLPNTLKRAYCTYKYYSDAECEHEITTANDVYDDIYVKYDYTGPFAFSKEGESPEYVYYLLRTYSNNFLYANGSSINVTTTSNTEDAYQWAIVGNPYAYTLKNKSTGTYMVVSYSNNGEATLGASGTSFGLYTNTQSAVTNHFTAVATNGANLVIPQNHPNAGSGIRCYNGTGAKFTDYTGLNNLAGAFFIPFAVVTYNLIWNESTIQSTTKGSIIGTASEDEKPWDVPAYSSFVYDVTTIGKNTSTVNVTLNWDGPFDFSTDFASAKWYYMAFNGGYLIYDETPPYGFSTREDAIAAGEDAIWAFIGDPYNGVRVINKTAGNGKYLNVNTTVQMVEGTYPKYSLCGITENSTSETIGFSLDNDDCYLCYYVPEEGDPYLWYGTGKAWAATSKGRITVEPIVIYNLKFGSSTIATKTVDKVTGDSENLLPSEWERDFCTYSYEPAKIGNSTTSVDVTMTWNGPFDISADYENAVWYYLAVNGKWSKQVAFEAPNIYDDISEVKGLDVGEWAFYGNPYDGFLLSPKAKYSTYQIYLSSAAETPAFTPATESTEKWVAKKISGSTFTLNCGDKYLVDNSTTMGFKTTALEGSEGTFSVRSYYCQQALDNWTTYVGESTDKYFGVRSESASSMDGMIKSLSKMTKTEYDTNFATIPNENIAIYISYNKPTTGYYRIKNNGTGNYLAYGTPTAKGKTPSAGLIATSNNTDAASIIKLTASSEKYKLSVQGLNIQSQTNSNVAFPGTDAEGVDFVFNVSTPGVVSITNAASKVDDNHDGSLHEGTDGWTVHGVVNFIASNPNSKWVVEDATGFDVAMNGPVGDNYYATLCVPFDVTISDATAYTLAKSESGNYLVPTEVTDNKVPAGTPVLLKGTNATATATINTGLAFGSPLDCVLTGIYMTTSVDATTNYVFGKFNGKVGFYHVDNEEFSLKANRAYLKATTNQARGFVLNFDDEATGIVSTPGETEEGTVIYNLSGQRLNKMQKGINIVNGKKVLF